VIAKLISALLQNDSLKYIPSHIRMKQELKKVSNLAAVCEREYDTECSHWGLASKRLTIRQIISAKSSYDGSDKYCCKRESWRLLQGFVQSTGIWIGVVTRCTCLAESFSGTGCRLAGGEGKTAVIEGARIATCEFHTTKQRSQASIVHRRY
jgi:hypothetical protein